MNLVTLQFFSEAASPEAEPPFYNQSQHLQVLTRTRDVNSLAIFAQSEGEAKFSPSLRFRSRISESFRFRFAFAQDFREEVAFASLSLSLIFFAGEKFFRFRSERILSEIFALFAFALSEF